MEEPPKSTSSGFSARISDSVADDAAAQTIASETFDLPEPFGSDHDGHPGLELHLDRVRERLEAAQLDGAQVHRARTLTAATDGGSPHRRGSQADGG